MENKEAMKRGDEKRVAGDTRVVKGAVKTGGEGIYTPRRHWRGCGRVFLIPPNTSSTWSYLPCPLISHPHHPFRPAIWLFAPLVASQHIVCCTSSVSGNFFGAQSVQTTTATGKRRRGRGKNEMDRKDTEKNKRTGWLALEESE